MLEVPKYKGVKLTSDPAPVSLITCNYRTPFLGVKQIVRFKTKTKIHRTNLRKGFPSKIRIEKNRPRRNSLDKKRTDTAALEKKARFFGGRKKNRGFFLWSVFFVFCLAKIQETAKISAGRFFFLSTDWYEFCSKALT